MPLQWYGGGKERPVLQKIMWDAFKLFGQSLEMDPSPTPPASDASYFYRFTPAIDASEYHHYFHTDWETPEAVPWTGLESATRAFAKIVDEVNKLPLSTFMAGRYWQARRLRRIAKTGSAIATKAETAKGFDIADAGHVFRIPLVKRI